jgi:lipopolysaccharide export system permease protein
MKVYVSFIIKIFIKSIFFVSAVMLSLAIIINTLTEFEFFSDVEVAALFPFYLSLLNSPTLLFEMFPFIFLISTQLFFINLLNNNEIEVFKYSGLKNSSIIKIISIVGFLLGVFIIIIFYNLSSNLKNYYLEIKSKYTKDGKYLAVITNNGLWIKDVVEGKTNIINASKIDQNTLIDAFITQFNSDYEVLKNIKSKKINIKDNEWKIFNAKVYENQTSAEYEILKYQSNFNYNRIQSLFSNLSSLSLKELFILKKNYDSLNYSVTEVSVQIHKIISYPFYLTLMTIFSIIVMFKTKKLKSSTLKIAIGLFFSVIIYYTFNFFNVMGNTEKFSIVVSVWLPILILTIINLIMTNNINEK